MVSWGQIVEYSELFTKGGSEGGDSEATFSVTGPLKVIVWDAETRNKGDRRRACVPKKGVNIGQLADVVVQWLQTNPQARHYAAAGLVAEAVSKAFPCR